MSEFQWTSDHAAAFTDHYVIVEGKAASTAKKYCRYSNMFFSWVNKMDLSLDKSTVEAWMKHIYVNQNNRANSTRSVRLSGVRTVCKWLFERGDIALNPCIGVQSPKVQKKSAQKFSAAELKVLFREAPSKNVTNLRDRTILLLFYATGVRREEMCNLSLERLTLGSRQGRVHIIGKGRKHRTIPFDGPVVALLKTWLATRSLYALEAADSVFVSLQGKGSGKKMSTQAMHDTIKRVAARNGLRPSMASLHKLRSTYATTLYDANVPLIEIARLMGHSSVTTTEEYVAITERHLRNARIPASLWDELVEKP